MFASTKLSTVALIGFALAALVNAGPVPNDASTADQGTALLGRDVSIPNTANNGATGPSWYAACYDSYGGCCPYRTYCQAGSSYCYGECGATAGTCADGGS